MSHQNKEFGDDLDALRKKIIDELIFTHKSLEEIKREMQQI